MANKNYYHLFFLFILVSGCYSVPHFEYFIESGYNVPTTRTKIKKKKFSKRYNHLMLTLGELGLGGGSLDEIIIQNDTILIKGYLMDEEHKDAIDVYVNPIQKVRNKLTKRESYLIKEEFFTKSDSLGFFELKIPEYIQIHGIIMYYDSIPDEKISTWLFYNPE
jgi:hypothetical protein